METIRKPPGFEPVTDRRKFQLQSRTLTIMPAHRAELLRELILVLLFVLCLFQLVESRNVETNFDNVGSSNINRHNSGTP